VRQRADLVLSGSGGVDLPVGPAVLVRRCPGCVGTVSRVPRAAVLVRRCPVGRAGAGAPCWLRTYDVPVVLRSLPRPVA